MKWCKHIFLPLENKRRSVFIISLDLTRPKKSEDILGYSEERLRQMIESSNQIFWITEFHPREVIYVSPDYEKIFSQTLQELIADPDAYLKQVHPDDLEYVRGRYNDLSVETGDEYRIIDNDGEIRWLHSKTFPIKNPEGLVYRKCGIVEDVTERKQALEERKIERKELMEKNIALGEVLKQIEEEKERIRQDIAENIAQVIMPALKKLVASDGTVNITKLKVVESSLQEMALFSEGIMHLYAKLSPREVEICAMIKNGSTTKEIAEAMYISTSTVKKHREKIRKKLSISNKKINLASFLKQL